MNSIPNKVNSRLPTLFIPHGGGPCFFMYWTMGPPNTWQKMEEWLRELGTRCSEAKTILVVSGHWEESVVTVQSGGRPPLLFDYYGFPPHTYKLQWPAPGEPKIAERVKELLNAAGIVSKADRVRGFDHGVFIPMKVMFPDAAIPTLQLSLDASLDSATHLAIGRALEPLRDEGVLIIGSGMSFHNMQAMMMPGSALDASRAFDDWLVHACEKDATQRNDLLSHWAQAPHARDSHPREEHLLPLMVAAGAANEDTGQRIFNDQVMGVEVSAFQFGHF